MFAFLRALTGAILAALTPRASLVAENLALCRRALEIAEI